MADEEKNSSGAEKPRGSKKDKPAAANGKKHPEQERAEKEEKRSQREHGRSSAPEKETDKPSEHGGTEKAPETSEPAEKEAVRPFPIVGIGASAGGLEALESFFENLPQQSGIAFVVVTHTDPRHNSLLPSIIRRKTKTPVEQAADATAIEKNRIYLPPADQDILIQDRVFRLKKRQTKETLHMPIDLFFKSLAEFWGERSGCVILSGTGTDGTHGLRAVKEQAGLTIVQDLETAKHQGMLRSAVETGMVDEVLSPAEMPGRLVDYFRDVPRMKPFAAKEDKPGQNGEKADALKRILSFLANRINHDFSDYKQGTLKRRIARRITVTRCKDASEYLKLLHRENGEIRMLFQDLLIGVTNFFREPEAFDFLKDRVLPDLLKGKSRNSPLRVWIPGCATGEEAFSASIAIGECLTENELSREYQIFGTDIDGRAIEKARTGEYLPNIASDVSAERLERFFTKKGDRYRVNREIREPVIFAEQNVLRDPPFSDLDLLVCRNLLIYLQPSAQEKLIPLFHYTLNKNGILFLGNSETTGRYPELFEAVSKTHSIYRKKETAAVPHVRFPTGKMRQALVEGRREAAEQGRERTHLGLEEAAKGVLLAEFTPAGVLIGRDGEILYTHGRTGKYLELTPGKPNLNISEMARQGLRFSLLSAMRKAKETDDKIHEKGIRVKTNGEHQWIDLIVKAFDSPPLEETLMVVFVDVPEPLIKPAKPQEEGDEKERAERVEELEHELVRARQDYRGAMEELETSNEELRSINEEMQSSNEELQSTNEELESSREELQSLNEELNTVNSELQNKIEELEDANRAITSVLDSTHIAMVFLDTELKVSRFTQEATRLINLIESDNGRPLTHISTRLQDVELTEKAGKVLDSLSPIQDEVETEDGHWYRMNILIHRKEDHVIEGVVMTFINIDEQKQTQQKIEELGQKEIRSAKRFAENIVDTVREALIVLDENMQVITANRRFYDRFQTSPEKTEGKRLFELGNGQWDVPDLRRLLHQTVTQRKSFEDYRVEHDFPNIGRKKMVLNARHLVEEDRQNRILLAIEDIAEKSENSR